MVAACVPNLSADGARAQAEPLEREARRMLAERLNAPVDEIGIQRIDARQWPDTSLDCPEPGFAYAGVITPGYRILLTHAGRTYAFHSSASRVVYCPQDRA